MFTVLTERPGSSQALEVTPYADSVRYSTAAVGGFGAASFRMPGQERRLPPLTAVRLFWGSTLLWEGRVEDVKFTLTSDNAYTDFTCFGYRRLLEEQSIKRVWSLRSINWSAGAVVTGLGTACGPPTYAPATMTVQVGQFDATDLSRVGILVSPQGAAANNANWAVYQGPASLVFIKTIATAKNTGTDGFLIAYDSQLGTSWTNLYCDTPGGFGAAVTLTNSGNANQLMLGFRFNTSGGGSWEDIRILGTTLSEDEFGGFYGSSILNDLLSFVPGLRAGIIESGSDFVIPAIGRTARDTSLSVVEEVAAFYRREWGVWDNRTFNWQSPNLDESQWTCLLEDVSGLEIEASIDQTQKTVYLLYEDAASGQPAEVSTSSTDRRNVYVRSGDSKDEVLQSPVTLTSRSANRLIDRLIEDHGGMPLVRGRVTLPPQRLIRHAGKGLQPAFTLRAGENITFPELPKDDYFRPGRDGQTLFHIASAETDMEKQTTILELEGYSRASDILLARLASVTRVVTGG